MVYVFCRLFTDDEISRIKNLRVYDIIMAVTKMDSNDIPLNPFRASQGSKSKLLLYRYKIIFYLNTNIFRETYKFLFNMSLSMIILYRFR